MMELGITVHDLIWVLVGITAIATSIVAMARTGRSSVGDERERIVRIEANTSETRSDVADIKSEMRSVKGDVSDHERRIIQLEASDDALNHRLDEHGRIIATMHDEHIANHGIGGEGTD